MLLVEKHKISCNHPSFRTLKHYCDISKKLYNSANYQLRANYLIMQNDIMSYPQLDRIAKNSNLINQFYYNMPNTKVAQQTLKKLCENWKAYIKGLSTYYKDRSKFKGKPKPPKYIKNNIGFELHFNNQSSKIKDGYLHLTKSTLGEFSFKTNIDSKQFKYAKICPINSFSFNLFIGYEIEDGVYAVKDKNYAAIDLGINNLATLTFTNNKPQIINGKPIKSINQYYNKLKAKIQEYNLSHKYIDKLSIKRNNKINDYLHKASTYIVKQLVDNNISQLVIGKNNGWKQVTKMSKKNNQNFVEIPFNRFIFMLEYKCKIKGINVEVIEESYTSKCSFLDKEEICKHNAYLGKRVRRGLFQTKDNKLINADVNGSYNILRKYLNEAKNINIYKIINLVEACSTPIVNTIRFN